MAPRQRDGLAYGSKRHSLLEKYSSRLAVSQQEHRRRFRLSCRTR